MGKIYNGTFDQDGISFDRVKTVGIQYPVYPLLIMGDDGVQLGPDAINNGQFTTEDGGIINAIDIDWNGAILPNANLNGTENNNYKIYTTGQLMQLLNTIQKEIYTLTALYLSAQQS